MRVPLKAWISITLIVVGSALLAYCIHQLGPDPADPTLPWISIWCIGTGIALLVRVGIQVIGAPKRSLRIFPGMVLRNILPLQRHSPTSPIKALPDFGLMCGCLLFIVMFIFMVFEPLTSRGLLVNIPGRYATVWHKSPWPETLVVYVDAQRNFYVNGKHVPREELLVKLREELGKRMVWTVYFEADKDSTYGDAIYSIDAIQGLGAEVFWITPHVRAELDRASALAKR